MTGSAKSGAFGMIIPGCRFAHPGYDASLTGAMEK
jgi:hypothetical protein